MNNSRYDRALEIARSNANAAIDQANTFKDSIGSYAQNVRDSLDEEGLNEHTDSAFAVYYSRIGALLLEQNSAPAPNALASADSAAAAVNSGGATPTPQVLENGRTKVTICADRMSGWFEYDGEAIGGLVFGALTSRDPNAIELVDYYGVFALPKAVAILLRDAGVHVDSTFM